MAATAPPTSTNGGAVAEAARWRPPTATCSPRLASGGSGWPARCERICKLCERTNPRGRPSCMPQQAAALPVDNQRDTPPAACSAAAGSWGGSVAVASRLAAGYAAAERRGSALPSAVGSVLRRQPKCSAILFHQAQRGRDPEAAPAFIKGTVGLLHRHFSGMAISHHDVSAGGKFHITATAVHLYATEGKYIGGHAVAVQHAALD